MTKTTTATPKIHIQCDVRAKVPSAYLLRKWARLVLAERRPDPAARQASGSRSSKDWVLRMATPYQDDGTSYELTIRIVGKAESQALNHSFRGKDKPTNVLAFPEASGPYLGDLAICHAIVAEEAKAQGKTLAAHYAHMVIHGILHLLGDDHILDEERQQMEAKEIRLLAKLNYANPYEVD